MQNTLLQSLDSTHKIVCDLSQHNQGVSNGVDIMYKYAQKKNKYSDGST